MTSHRIALVMESATDGLQRVPFKNVMMLPKYANPIRQNSIGRRTQYYNPSTGETYIETVLFYNKSLQHPLGTIVVGSNKKR
jgi:hypothetical protein